MRIVFISNYFNHHQLHLSDCFYELVGDDYYFIETTKIPDFRKQLGYNAYFNKSYLKQYYESSQKAECEMIIDEADVVIIGSAPYSLIKKRLNSGKLTFIYTERIYKDKESFVQILKHNIKFYFMYKKFKKLFCLCSSAFTSFDFSKTGTFSGKCLKWGYFPERKVYANINDILNKKTKNSILWCGRFIDWKHPEFCVELGKFLDKLKINYTITMIGTGPLLNSIKQAIIDNDLKNIKIVGSLSPEEVRNYMEKSQIFLFTSGRKEGWGAVLNEAMNSGCSVIASSEIGSVPFLVDDHVNGLIYRDGDIDDFLLKVKYLMDEVDICKCLGTEAYKTIFEHWNAQTATNRFINIAELLLEESNASLNDILYPNGPCSKAEIIKDGWYK